MTDKDEVRQMEYVRAEEEEETIGETDRWGWGGVWGGEREERHGSQSAHTVESRWLCAVSPARHSHSRRSCCVPGKGGRRLNAILY